MCFDLCERVPQASPPSLPRSEPNQQGAGDAAGRAGVDAKLANGADIVGGVEDVLHVQAEAEALVLIA